MIDAITAVVFGLVIVSSIAFVLYLVVPPILTLYYGAPEYEKEWKLGGHVLYVEDDGKPHHITRYHGDALLDVYKFVIMIICIIAVLYVIGTVMLFVL
jgi:hypothetical protein